MTPLTLWRRFARWVGRNDGVNDPYYVVVGHHKPK